MQGCKGGDTPPSFVSQECYLRDSTIVPLTGVMRMAIKRRKDASERREVILTMRLNEEESEALRTAVEESGLTQSDILRTALRGVIRGLEKGFKRFLDDSRTDTAGTPRRKGLTSTNGNGHK